MIYSDEILLNGNGITVLLLKNSVKPNHAVQCKLPKKT